MIFFFIVLLYLANKIYWIKFIYQYRIVNSQQYYTLLTCLLISGVIMLYDFTNYRMLFFCQFTINCLLAIFIFYNFRNYFFAIFVSFTQYILIMSIRIPIGFFLYFQAEKSSYAILSNTTLFILTVLIIENIIYIFVYLFFKDAKYKESIESLVAYFPQSSRSINFSITFSVVAYMYIQYYVLDLFSLPFFIAYFCFLLISVIWLLQTLGTSQKNRYAVERELNASYINIADQNVEKSLNIQHDIKNLLFTITAFLKEDKTEEALSYIAEIYTYTQHNTIAFEEKELMKIKILPIRELLLNKLKAAHLHDISTQLIVNQPVFKIDMKLLDMVRIIGIYLDNAIEYVANIDDKNLVVSFTQEQNGLIIIIENPIASQSSINISQILTKGFTTKKEHLGRGLYIVSELSQKYKHVDYSISVNDGWFQARLITHTK
ncbi:hypothetical protein X559_2957 [Paenilisteria newyorkensis]|nr:hypothetical protein X559_2957 [Listeria newyorkensis]